MVDILDVGGDLALFDEVEDCCADFHHGDDAWLHAAECAGEISQHVVFVVGGVVDTDRDISG